MSSSLEEILKKLQGDLSPPLQATQNAQDIDIPSFLRNYNFQMPIEYKKHQNLSDTVRADLEMVGGYENIMNHIIGRDGYNLLLDKWSSIYSLDSKYLKEQQNLTRKYKYFHSSMDTFIKTYADFKQQKNFLSKYQYIQFKRFRTLNTVSTFLQFLALYNFCSPLFSLLAPVIGLIMPYVVLYMKGIRLGFSQYYKLIQKIVLNQYLIKGFVNFTKNSLQTNAYLLTSVFFYGLSIYNNVLSCLDFYKNVQFLIGFVDDYDKFIKNGEKLIEHIMSFTKSKKTFAEFNKTMDAHKTNISAMKDQLSIICDCKEKYMKYGNIGHLLKCNFDLYYSPKFDETIGYLIYLNNYNNDLFNISKLVQSGTLNYCKYTKDKRQKPRLEGNYYLPHISDNIVDNDIKLEKNIIITGPNASGKTTLIKSILINMFLSQSIGCGCYRSCRTNIYDHFHSYLNIPDTSNRDSLFQAEARRCKDIILFVEKHRNKKHFCIFDEIYSGTNPSDAVLCAIIYLSGLNDYKETVDYVLTTHYIDMCEKFEDDDTVVNKKMLVNILDDDTFEYTYKLREGISKINGGYKILEQLDYPRELLEKYKK